jgi:hypothetical protein
MTNNMKQPRVKRLLVLGAALLLVAACRGETRTEVDPAVRALQIALLERGSRDQALRDSALLPGADPGLRQWIQVVDQENAEWLKAQVAIHGWPSQAKVGESARTAAFLILEHASHDPAFQAAMLDTLTAAWGRGEGDGPSYALLYDRVQAQGGREQRYGTQARMVKGVLVFDPMEDSAKVDSLRQAVGLPSLADYRRVLDSVYRSPAPPK